MNDKVDHGAFKCQQCGGDSTWRILRRGDAAVSWACTVHLSDECWLLQRDFETTELVVTWSTP